MSIKFIIIFSFFINSFLFSCQFEQKREIYCPYYFINQFEISENLNLDILLQKTQKHQLDYVLLNQFIAGIYQKYSILVQENIFDYIVYRFVNIVLKYANTRIIDTFLGLIHKRDVEYNLKLFSFFYKTNLLELAIVNNRYDLLEYFFKIKYMPFIVGQNSFEYLGQAILYALTSEAPDFRAFVIFYSYIDTNIFNNFFSLNAYENLCIFVCKKYKESLISWTNAGREMAFDEVVLLKKFIKNSLCIESFDFEFIKKLFVKANEILGLDELLLILPRERYDILKNSVINHSIVVQINLPNTTKKFIKRDPEIDELISKVGKSCTIL